MPQIFKALASITAWILFIFGCLTVLITSVMGTIGGTLFTAELPPMEDIFLFGLAVVSLALSVVCMKLRQILE